MSRWRPFWFFLFGVLAIDAPAQDEPRHTALPVCRQLFCESDPAPAPNGQPNVLLRLASPRRPPARQYTYPFEQYHARFHNDFLHPFVVTAVTSYHKQRSVYFSHWYSSRKGFDLVQLGAGRVGLGVETQRVFVTAADRRTSNPLFTSDNCYASGFQATSACYSNSFRGGDRRYGLALRIYLGRPR